MGHRYGVTRYQMLPKGRLLPVTRVGCRIGRGPPPIVTPAAGRFSLRVFSSFSVTSRQTRSSRCSALRIFFKVLVCADGTRAAMPWICSEMYS